MNGKIKLTKELIQDAIDNNETIFYGDDTEYELDKETLRALGFIVIDDKVYKLGMTLSDISTIIMKDKRGNVIGKVKRRMS